MRDGPLRVFMASALAVLFFYSTAQPQSKEQAKSRWDSLFETEVRKIDTFDASKLKELGSAKSLPHVTVDEVWGSAVKVLLQQGVIIFSSRNDGVLVATTPDPPLSALTLGVVVQREEARRISLLTIEGKEKNLTAVVDAAVKAIEAGETFDTVSKTVGSEGITATLSARDEYLISQELKKESPLLSEKTLSLQRGEIGTIESEPDKAYIIRVEDVRDVVTVYIGSLSGSSYESVSTYHYISALDTFFDSLRTQVYAREKWKYLLKPSP